MCTSEGSLLLFRESIAVICEVIADGLMIAFFYLRHGLVAGLSRLGVQTQRSLGFVFATCYAMVSSPIVCNLFQHRPLPRINDIFLVGIVLTTYLFTWEAAAYLLSVSVVVSAWVFPPYGSLAVDHMEDWYRIISFVVLSVFVIVLVHRLKGPAEERTKRRQTVMRTHSMLAGD